jgi:two-component system NtrC family sensor kinase
MRKIVVDLCSFASPDKGVNDRVELEALMESMLNIVWNEIKYKAQLKKEYGKVPSIVCNSQKIGQVFVNLLTNAAHAIEGKGFISIRTYTKDQFVCVDVGDTGCGIPAENITRIFDPFFTTKKVGRGVGLGLSVSYDIIRRHGGSLTFAPKSDKGTIFTVMLPTEYAHDLTPV